MTTITAVVTLLVMAFYTNNVLQGNIDNHVLSARHFGVPEAVAKHGFHVFYDTPTDGGWDGQFYFYIANDPLALKDTAKHLDFDAYRYQRIGLPLLAWVASRVSLQTWVSPVAYYLTNLAVVLAATLYGGRYFARRGYGAWPILLWSLSLGVQLTLMNGLPDATADALLILSLVCHFEKKRVGYALFATLAALSREAYILFPVVIGAFEWADTAGLRPWQSTSLEGRRQTLAAMADWCIRRAWIYALPVLCFLGWQLHLRLHFHIAPSSQAYGILGALLKSWFEYVEVSILRSHPLFGPGLPTRRELVALILFMGSLVVCASVATMALRRRAGPHDAVTPVAITALTLTLLYACFGKTVMEHYTGYAKAAGLFFLIVPFLWGSLGNTGRIWAALPLVVTNLYLGYYVWVDRVDPDRQIYDIYTQASKVTDSKPKTCLRSFASKVALVGLEDLQSNTLLTRLDDRGAKVFRVAVTNDTGEPFTATNTVGSVNVGYHWLNADGTVVIKDSLRSFLTNGLAPGATITVPVVVEYPVQPGHYLLRISLVQEGCTWFYNADPASKLDIDYVVR